MPRLDVHQIERYQRDGFIFPIGVLTAETAAAHRHRLAQVEAQHGAMHYRTKPYLLMGSAWEIATHAELLDAVESVLGPDILLWDCAYIVKEPRSADFVAWHQDLTYWGLDSDAVATAWVALGAATADNGCMRMLPGSHRGGRLPHVDAAGTDNLLHRGQRLSDAVAEAEAVDVVLAAGEASLHHGWVAHSSLPNRSAERRVGLAMQYVAPSVRQRHTDLESATLVRGVDRYRHFRAEPRFETDFHPQALAFQQQAQRLKNAVYDT